jgi:hypothetical protein
MNIYLRELKANFRSLIIWSIIVILFTVTGISKFSAYYNNPDRKRSRAVADAESRVHELEAQLAQLEQDLHDASGGQDVTEIEQLGQRYVETQSALDEAMETWMALADGQAA